MPQRGFYAIRSFENESEMQAYAAGLQEGINFECQPGSEPCRVRTEHNMLSDPDTRWSAFIQSGHYSNDGNIVWH